MKAILGLCLLLGCAPTPVTYSPDTTVTGPPPAEPQRPPVAKTGTQIASVEASEDSTFDTPFLVFNTVYVTAMCKAKKACPITGVLPGEFSEDVCLLQMLKHICIKDGINLCNETNIVRLRRKEWLACLGQLSTEWSCDYSRPMDMCMGQYIVKPKH